MKPTIHSEPDVPLAVLAGRLIGTVHSRGDDTYAELARDWFAAEEIIAVVDAADADDVAATVLFANDHNLEVVTAWPLIGDSTGARKILVRLHLLDEIELAADRHRGSGSRTHVRVGAGTRWRSLGEVAGANGLAVASAGRPEELITESVAHGGFGVLARVFGRSSDAVRALEVVCGDGVLRRVSPVESPALFWALRGGHRLLGILTAVEMEVTAPPALTVDTVYFSDGDSDVAARFWADWSLSLPDRAATSFSLLRLPKVSDIPVKLHGTPAAAITLTWSGSDRGRSTALAELTDISVPAAVRSEPLAALVSTLRPILHRTRTTPWPPDRAGEDRPAAGTHVDRSLVLRELPPAAMRVLLSLAQGDGRVLEVQRLGGEAADSGAHTSAVARRHGEFLLLAPAAPLDAQEGAWWARVVDALRPWALAPALQDRAGLVSGRISQLWDGATLERLLSLSLSYDPRGVIHEAVALRTLARAPRGGGGLQWPRSSDATGEGEPGQGRVSMDENIRYRILGQFVLEGDNGPISGPYKQHIVLAVLALFHNRPVPTSRLVCALWGDEPPRKAETSVYAYLSNLRKILRDGSLATTLATREPGYVLDTPRETIDAAVFVDLTEAARIAAKAGDWETVRSTTMRALSLWRGELPDEFSHDDWLRSEVNMLERLRGECQEMLTKAMLAVDAINEALGLVEQLHDRDPLDERIMWLWMMVLHRNDNSVRALNEYQAHAKLLEEELGVDPGPALRDLYAAILRQDPDLSIWPRTRDDFSIPSVVEPNPTEPPDDDGATPHTHKAGSLVGRQREIEAIRALRSESASDPGTRWVVLTGPSGIGKTRLAQEAVHLLDAPQTRVMRVSCPDDPGMPLWWPIRSVIRTLGGDPDLLLAPPPDSDADAGRYAVYERLDGLLHTVADARAIIVVDDLQWADSASLAWLGHLTSSQPRSDVTFVLTVRDDLIHTDLEQLLATLARQPLSAQLALTPLSVAEVGQLASLIAAEDITDAEAATIAELTGGNPFFVGELARLPREERLSGEIPVAVRSVLRKRLSAVDPQVLSVLRLAALISGPFDIELVCAAARIDRAELGEVLEEAIDAHIVVSTGDGEAYSFVHELLRAEVLAGLSLPRRQRLHARIADALRDASTQDRLAQRATHLLASAPLVEPQEVYEACRSAAQDAEDRWMPDIAATWWHASIRAYDQMTAAQQDNDTRDDLLLAHAAALASSGQAAAVMVAVEDGLRDAWSRQRHEIVGALASVLLRVAGAWPWVSYAEHPERLMAVLMDLEPRVADFPRTHARVLAACALGSYYSQDPTLRDRLSARAITIAETTNDSDVLSDILLARAICFSGVADSAEKVIDALLRFAELPRPMPPRDAVLRHNLLALTEFARGNIARVDEHLRAGIESSDLLRLPVCRLQFRWIEAALALWRGDVDGAARLIQRAYDMHRQTGLYVHGIHELALTSLQWARGRLVELAPLPDRHASMLPYGKPAVLIARGEHTTGTARASEALGTPQPNVWTTAGELALLAHAVADAELESLAHELLTRLLPFSGRIGMLGHVGVIGPVDHAIAKLYLLTGDPEAAARYAKDALVLAQRAEGSWSVDACRQTLDAASKAERSLAKAVR